MTALLVARGHLKESRVEVENKVPIQRIAGREGNTSK